MLRPFLWRHKKRWSFYSPATNFRRPFHCVESKRPPEQRKLDLLHRFFFFFCFRVLGESPIPWVLGVKSTVSPAYEQFKPKFRRVFSLDNAKTISRNQLESRFELNRFHCNLCCVKTRSVVWSVYWARDVETSVSRSGCWNQNDRINHVFENCNERNCDLYACVHLQLHTNFNLWSVIG